MKTALVLSGGGARGAYQMGVYKALKKQKIDISIITGTSIGALNGCMFVQGDYKKALKMWNNLSFSSVMEDASGVDLRTLKGKTELFSKYIKALINEGGFEIDKIEATVKNAFNPYKFYSSNIDFGLVTVRLSDLKPVMLTKKDLKQDKIIDYLVASSAIFPAFQKKKIDDQVFIDGGYYDNLPIELAIKMGAEKIIAVDLDVVGRKKTVKSDVDMTYIKPISKLGNFLDFDKDEAKRSMIIGYNDAMKAFQKYEGKKYTFKKRHIYYNALAYEENFQKNLNEFVKFKTPIGNQVKKSYYKKYFDEDYSKYVLDILDYIGTTFDVCDEEVYGVFKFNNQVRTKFSKIHRVESKRINSLIDKERIENPMDKKILIKHIYNYLEKGDFDNLNVFAAIFPNEYVAAIYLYTIYH